MYFPLRMVNHAEVAIQAVMEFQLERYAHIVVRISRNLVCLFACCGTHFDYLVHIADAFVLHVRHKEMQVVQGDCCRELYAGIIEFCIAVLKGFVISGSGTGFDHSYQYAVAYFDKSAFLRNDLFDDLHGIPLHEVPDKRFEHRMSLIARLHRKCTDIDFIHRTAVFVGVRHVAGE